MVLLSPSHLSLDSTIILASFHLRSEGTMSVSGQSVPPTRACTFVSILLFVSNCLTFRCISMRSPRPSLLAGDLRVLDSKLNWIGSNSVAARVETDAQISNKEVNYA